MKEPGFTLGFHTRTCNGPSSICFKRTGCGHDLVDELDKMKENKSFTHHRYIIMKNRLTIAPAIALG